MKFTSLKYFYNALSEVDILVSSAKENEKEKIKYLTYNKATILLLTSKFESFLENLIEEYIDYINSMNIKAKYLPEVLKINHTIHSINNSQNIIGHAHKIQEQVNLFESISNLWDGNNIFNKLCIKSKFNYGKHGEKDLIKLFKNIGIQNIFDEVKIFETENSMLGYTKKQLDFKGKFNSLIYIRNNIVHQDDTPNLTHIDVIEYKKFIIKFVNELIVVLENKLDEIKNRSINDSNVTIAEVAATQI